jgi:cytochrome P450
MSDRVSREQRPHGAHGVDTGGGPSHGSGPVAIPPANITTPEFKARAYPYYARLRAEAAVLKVKLPNGPAWLVSRYDDVAALLKDGRLAKTETTRRAAGR